MQQGGTAVGKPASYEPVTVFKPQRWRLFLLDVGPQLLPVAILLAGLAVPFFLGRPVEPEWPNLLQIALPVVIILYLLGRTWTDLGKHRVAVSSDSIRFGPEPRRLFRRASGARYLDLTEIDSRKSARRSWLDRLAGHHRIFTTSGRHVVLRRRAFDPADFRRLLGILNIRE